MQKPKATLGFAALLFAVVASQAAQAQVPAYVDPVIYTVNPDSFPATTYPTGYQLNNNYPWESTYPFSPSYSATEQQIIINDELARTGGELGTDPVDGSPNITINQGIIPEAHIENVQPAVVVATEVTPPSNGTTPFSRSYYRKNDFGNSLFGAGYIIDAAMTASPATGVAEKKVEAYADGKVFAVAFGAEREIVRGRAELTGQQGGNNSGTARLYAMGQQIWSGNLYTSFEITPINWSRTFFSVSKRFMVGPVPVSVAASVGGGVKLTVSGQVGPTIARLTTAAGGWANATASAGVDIIVAGVGVEGNLVLVNVSLPAFAELFWPFYSLDYTLRSNLNLTALSGNIKLWVRVGFWFLKKTWRVTIASWSGTTQNWPLFTQNGSLILGMEPMGM
ncbi:MULTISPECIES: hypothetical protein [unclassified Myxococcus]|uniref:hypothetical protein n=1 Tax=unclassified Myxococcus TaxID=2648731 RepID=UPI00114733FA|nr:MULTISPECIES: hypothetical protein [unclassified Myxococcus]